MLFCCKSNEATPQRPQGDRVLDAPLITMDLQQSIQQLQDEPSWKDSDRNSVALFKSDNIRIVLMGLHQNAELKKHTTKGIINLQVELLDEKLPDLHEEIDSSVDIVNSLLEELQAYREKYFTDNKLAVEIDPTAKSNESQK